MTACKTSETLEAYARDQLTAADVLTVEKHLQHCDHCCIELSRLVQVIESNSGQSTTEPALDVEVPPDVDASSSGSPAYLWWKGVGQNAAGLVDQSIPERIGRYRVLNLLGSGGFGRVFLALDEKLDRKVAIKVPHTNSADSQSPLELILAEAKTVANLDHPHIVPIYDVASCEEFPLYLVTKLIEGPNLARRMLDGVSQAEAVRWIMQIADALAYAHDQGLIHRDVKPHNILVEKCGNVCLSDFGLAWRHSAHSADYHRAGTPAYMSPEHMDGTQPIDHRADIFSLGRVLIELLHHDSEKRNLDSQDCQQVANYAGLPKQPSRTIELPPSLPAELEAICKKATAPEPNDRYQSAVELKQALHEYALASGWQATSGMHSGSLVPQIPSTLLSRRSWVTLGVLVLLCLWGWNYGSTLTSQRREARLIGDFLVAPAGELSLRLVELKKLSPTAEQGLTAACDSTDLNQRTRARIALLKRKPALAMALAADLLDADIELASVIAKELLPHKELVREQLWSAMADDKQAACTRLNATVFLVQAFTDDPLWSAGTARTVARLLVSDQTIDVTAYAHAFKPIRSLLISILRGMLDPNEVRPDPATMRIFHVWDSLVYDDIEGSIELLMESPVELADQILKRTADSAHLIEKLRAKIREVPAQPADPGAGRLHRQRFLAAYALLKLGMPDDFWNLWTHSAEPDLATVAIYLAHDSPTTYALVLDRLLESDLLQPRCEVPENLEERLFSPELSQRRNLLLAIFRSERWHQLKPLQKDVFLAKIQQLMIHDADSGMQAVALWMIKGNTHVSTWLAETWFPKDEIAPQPNSNTWSVNSLGQIMVHISHAPGIAHSFSLAQRELETRHYLQFLKETGRDIPAPSSMDNPNPHLVQRPAANTTWYECAAYCNWLSRREGLQECYQPNELGEYAEGMSIKANVLNLNGYRLPLNSEWEIGCRAGAKTIYSSGHLERYQAAFSWNKMITKQVSPVGYLPPNALGLFDMQGNVSEWTLDDPTAQSFQFRIHDQSMRATRGGHYDSVPIDTACHRFEIHAVNQRSQTIGFRLARTITSQTAP